MDISTSTATAASPNGDGRFTFGQAGDLPVVGDFNGDGVDEIGVYRDGKWIIDTNGNRQIDAHDKVFELGEAGDKPVVGDWNGDGIDDPGDVPRREHWRSQWHRSRPAAAGGLRAAGWWCESSVESQQAPHSIPSSVPKDAQNSTHG